MAYIVPDRHALLLELDGGTTPADRHALLFEMPAPDAPEPEPWIPPVMATIRMRWRPAATVEHQARLRFGDADRLDHQVRASWAPADVIERELGLHWRQLDAVEAQRRLRMSPADVVERQARLRWGNVLPVEGGARLRWGSTAQVGTARRLAWRNRSSTEQQRTLPWKQAPSHEHQVRLATGRAQVRELQARLPWGMADTPAFRYALPVPPQPPVPPRPVCYQPDRHNLEFRLAVRPGIYVPPDRHALEFGLICGDGRYFNVRSTLNVSHSVSVVRLPDRLPLHVRSGSLRTDRDAWCWSVSLAFADMASALAVEPTEDTKHSVEITLDGYTFTAQIDSYTEDRAFGSRAGSSSAKSRTAMLAAPDAPQRSYVNPVPATAQQLALRELEFTDFALDWQIADWTVPAGAFAYERDTPINAIGRIAKAAGAMLQSAPGTDTLVVAPRMPAAPWHFGAQVPAFTLAGGSWHRKGKRWNAGGRYNGVYVGGRHGILGHVWRDGTAGSPYAPDVVDPLICALAPATGAGLQVIADSLPRHEIPLELPLLPAPMAPGLLMPGELGAVEDVIWGNYRAVVDSLELSFDVDGAGLVTARQNATLWRYLP